MSCLGSLDDPKRHRGNVFLWQNHSPEGIKTNVSCSFGQSLEWCPLTRCVENFHYINVHDQFCKRCKKETWAKAKHVFCALEMNCLQWALLGSSGCLPYGGYHDLIFVLLHLQSRTGPAVPVQCAELLFAWNLGEFNLRSSRGAELGGARCSWPRLTPMSWFIWVGWKG